MAKNDTRDILIEKGISLVLHKGFNAAGIQEILSAAGVPKGSFYYYFKNKEEFGLCLLESYAQGHLARMEAMLTDAGKPPLDRLRLFFDSMTEYFESLDCRGGCLIGNLSQEMGDQNRVFAEQLEGVFRTWTEFVRECLREAGERGELAPDADPQKLADFILNSWEGAILRMKVTGNAEPLRLFSETVFANLLAPSKS